MRLLVVLLLGCAVVVSHPAYQDKIPNGKNVKDSQGNVVGGVGHIRAAGGGARNQFGKDFQAAGHKWTKELCKLDSDCDGFSNGVELGDPKCIWKEGDTPTFDAHITHPGERNEERVPPSNWCKGYAAKTGEKRQELTVPAYTIPAARTTYTKTYWRWPETAQSSAARKFEWIIKQPDHVHHFILYQCEADVTIADTDLNTSFVDKDLNCYQMLAAWAVGGKDVCWPTADLAINIPGNSLIMLEIHYDNPSNVPNKVDTSGLAIHYVPDAISQFTEVGVLAHFLVSGMNIPPNQAQYHVAETFQVGLDAPSSGVTFFFGGLHTHLLGRKVWANFEDVKTNRTSEVMCDTNYDFNLQEGSPFPGGFKTFYGAELKITCHCIMNSTTRTENTPGGLGTPQEMCGSPYFYYPKAKMTKYEVLKQTRIQEPWTGPDHVCTHQSAVKKNCTVPAVPTPAVPAVPTPAAPTTAANTTGGVPTTATSPTPDQASGAQSVPVLGVLTTSLVGAASVFLV